MEEVRDDPGDQSGIKVRKGRPPEGLGNQISVTQPEGGEETQEKVYLEDGNEGGSSSGEGKVPTVREGVGDVINSEEQQKLIKELEELKAQLAGAMKVQKFKEG